MRVFQRSRTFLALIALGTLLIGCFEVEHEIKLESDLSGTMSQRVTLNSEPMVYLLATMTKSFTGEEGPLTLDEIETARKDVQFDERETINIEELPEGVTLLSVDTSEDDYLIHHEVRFAFDHVSRLSQLAFSAGEDSEDAETPFEALQIVEEGDTLLITTTPVNPLAEQDEGWEQQFTGSPELEKIMTNALQGMRVAIIIEAPFEVLEHNATRQEGDRLFWEFDATALSEKPETLPTQIRVLYRK